MSDRPLSIGIVAGEASGDTLGSRLMGAIKARVDSVEFVGVGGEQMIAQGLEPLASLDVLSVNGFVDPIKRLPTLVRIIHRLYRRFLSVDVVVGVDFNVFNLLLERFLKRKGVPTAHYVSPAVYAWRRGRIKRIGRSTDLVMALFPFEPALYADRGVRAEFVGHPLADEIDPDVSSEERRASARRELGLPTDRRVVAVLPGSRLSEIEHLSDIFLDAGGRLEGTLAKPVVAVPCINPKVKEALSARAKSRPDLDIRLIDGQSRQVLAACDAALVKAGTGTLEAMLLRRPMVISYRLGPLTYRIVKALKRSEFVGLPNILANHRIVPELLQHDAQPDRLAAALSGEYERAGAGPEYFAEFDRLHRELRCDAAARAADLVLTLGRSDLRQ